MIIIAGALYLDPDDRDRYLAAVADVAPRARQAAGCLDFVQAPDTLEPDRINIFEMWESDSAVARFRDSDGPQPEVPPLRGADVQKYRVALIEAP